MHTVKNGSPAPTRTVKKWKALPPRSHCQENRNLVPIRALSRKWKTCPHTHTVKKIETLSPYAHCQENGSPAPTRTAKNKEKPCPSSQKIEALPTRTLSRNESPVPCPSTLSRNEMGSEPFCVNTLTVYIYVVRRYLPNSINTRTSAS